MSEQMKLDYTAEQTYWQTRKPVEEATTLIPQAYRCPQFANIERERVWAAGWVVAAYTSQLREPGSVAVTEVAGQPILITRNKQGSLRAFHNVCRHRGAQLVQSDCKRDVLRCPYHSWGYSLDGQLLGTPYFQGLDVTSKQQQEFDTSHTRGFDKSDFPLLPVAVDTWGCFVFVNLDGNAGPLSSWLGDLPQTFQRFPLAELELVRQQKFDIHANWKLVAENFMEYYHLPWVHPELVTVSTMDGHYRFQGTGMYTGMVTSPLRPNPNACTFDLANMPGLNAFESQTAFWIMLMPDTAWFLLPNHLFLLHYRPDGAHRTLESADMLVHHTALADAQAQQNIDRIFQFWAMVNQQDVTAVENVQRGLASRAYPGGRMCYRFEEPLHRFQNMIADLMTGQRRVPAGDEPKWDQELLQVACVKSSTTT